MTIQDNTINKDFAKHLSASKFSSVIRRMTEQDVESMSLQNAKQILNRVIENATSNMLVAFFSNSHLVAKLVELSVLNSLNFSALVYASKNVDRLGYVVNRRNLYEQIFKLPNKSLSARNFSVLYELCSTAEESRALYRNRPLIAELIKKKVLNFNEFVEKLKHAEVFYDFVKSEVFDEYFAKELISDSALTSIWNELFQTNAFKELSKFCSHKQMFSYVVRHNLVDFGNILKLKDLTMIDKVVQKLQELKRPTQSNKQKSLITESEFFNVVDQIVQQCDYENNIRVFSGLQSSAEIRDFISKKYEVKLSIRRKEQLTDELKKDKSERFDDIESFLQNKKLIVSSEELDLDDDQESKKESEKVELDTSQLIFPAPAEKELVEAQEDKFDISFLQRENVMFDMSDNDFENAVNRFFEEAAKERIAKK